MSTSIFDWPLYRGLFAPDEMQAIYSEESCLRHWLQVEQALASAQADLGMIPAQAAEEINRIEWQLLDRQALQMATAKVGRPIVGLVQEMMRLVGKESAEWVHYGATTQDIMDTATVLQLRTALQLIEQQLEATLVQLERWAEQGMDAVMVGRTNGQHALPITFGLKVAVWLTEFQRHQTRLQEIRARVLCVQLGGAVGTLAAQGEKGLPLRARFAQRLRLAEPSLHWQCARDSIAEVMLFMGLIGASVSKIGKAINSLASTEIAEVCERYSNGAGKSSAMPHKRNQRGSEFAEALGRLAKQRASGAYEICQHEHERSGAAWITEWILLPETMLAGAGALNALDSTLENLEIDRQQMRTNLELTNGMVLSEELVKQLEPVLGRREAKRRVETACALSHSNGQNLRTVLSEQPDLAALLTDQLEPTPRGLSDQLVAMALAREP